MNWFTPLTVWPDKTIAWLSRLLMRRVVLGIFVLAWLFLPVVSYRVASAPDVTKISLTSLGALLVVAAFDRRRLATLRPHLVDGPMAVFCLTPLAASITNSLGVYDGLSAVFERVVAWGIPYALGRLYCSDLDGLRDLALGILLGGLIYIPLCLYEIVNGPVLHTVLYGYPQGGLDQAWRFGGWRPTVFMPHGLMVALWMTAASVIGVWLWRSRSLTHLGWLPLSCAVPALLVTTALLKSVNAWVLALAGGALLLLTVKLRSVLPLLALVSAIGLYLFLRATGLWWGFALADMVGDVLGYEKYLSVAVRLNNEMIMTQTVHERPLFGWGRRPTSFYDRDDSEPGVIFDSMWIIVFAESGGVGLLGLIGVLLGPVLLVLRRFHPRTWATPRVAPVAALTLVLVLYALDSLMNAMLNPVYMLAVGGLVGGGVADDPWMTS